MNWNRISSKHRLCQYYSIDAPIACWQNALRKSYMGTAQAILKEFWKQCPTKQQLYSHSPPISKTIQVRRTRYAGHFWRSKDELISDVLLWIPTHGRASMDWLAITYIHLLCTDTGCSLENLPGAMDDRNRWRERENQGSPC